jgi:hypothetical protein
VAISGRVYTGQRHAFDDEPPFLWWRLVGVLFVLSFLGWGFISSRVCSPAPSKSQQIIFCFLLGLILLETIQAGWYRRHNPWELIALEYVVRVAKWTLYLLAFVLIVSALVYVISLIVDNGDPFLVLLLFVIPILILILIVVMAKDSDNRS